MSVEEREVVLLVSGPHGRTALSREDGKYLLVGDRPDRCALLMIARGVIDDASDEERAEIGAEDWL